jgi:hypothetical protein
MKHGERYTNDEKRELYIDGQNLIQRAQDGVLPSGEILYPEAAAELHKFGEFLQSFHIENQQRTVREIAKEIIDAARQGIDVDGQPLSKEEALSYEKIGEDMLRDNS